MRFEPAKVLLDPYGRATVVPKEYYFGSRVEERSLVPLGEARLGRIGLDEWLRSKGGQQKETK